MRLGPLLPLLAALVLASGCANPSIVATASPICEATSQVCISRDDKLTEGTATQIEANNLARRSICKPAGDPCAGMRVQKPKPVARQPPAEPKTS